MAYNAALTSGAAKLHRSYLAYVARRATQQRRCIAGISDNSKLYRGVESNKYNRRAEGNIGDNGLVAGRAAAAARNRSA